MKNVIEPLTTPPASDELKLRLDTVRAMMVAEELDYYVAAHTDNVYYLTNFAYMPFERPFFLIIPTEGKPCLVVPLLEVSHAEQRMLIEVDYHTYYEYPAPPGKTFIDTLRKAIGNDKRVGIESSLSIALQNEIPGHKVVCDLIDKARLIKTDYEIGRIAYAGKVTAIGMKKALSLAQPGPHIATIYSEGTKEMMES